MKKITIVILIFCFNVSFSQNCDSLSFYRSECIRLKVKVQLAQQNLFWLNRFVDIVAKNPSQSKFIIGWKNRVNAAKVFPKKIKK